MVYLLWVLCGSPLCERNRMPSVHCLVGAPWMVSAFWHMQRVAGSPIGSSFGAQVHTCSGMEDTCLGAELMNQRECRCADLWGDVTLFSRILISIYTHSSFSTTWYQAFLICQWRWKCVKIKIRGFNLYSSNNHLAQCLFLFFFPFVFSVKWQLMLVDHFSIGLICDTNYWFVVVPYGYGIQTLCCWYVTPSSAKLWFVFRIFLWHLLMNRSS